MRSLFRGAFPLLFAAIASAQGADADLARRLVSSSRVGVIAASSSQLNESRLAEASRTVDRGLHVEFLGKGAVIKSELLAKARASGFGTIVILSRLRTKVDKRSVPFFDPKGRRVNVRWSSARASLEAAAICVRTGEVAFEWTESASRQPPSLIRSGPKDDKKRRGLSKGEAADIVYAWGCAHAASHIFEHEARHVLPGLEALCENGSLELLADLSKAGAYCPNLGVALPSVVRGLQRRLQSMQPEDKVADPILSLLTAIRAGAARDHDAAVKPCLVRVERTRRALRSSREALLETIKSHTCRHRNTLQRSYHVLFLHNDEVAFSVEDLGWLWFTAGDFIWSAKPDELPSRLEDLASRLKKQRTPAMLLIHRPYAGGGKSRIVDKVHGDQITPDALFDMLWRATLLEEGWRQVQGDRGLFLTLDYSR